MAGCPYSVLSITETVMRHMTSPNTAAWLHITVYFLNVYVLYKVFYTFRSYLKISLNLSVYSLPLQSRDPSHTTCIMKPAFSEAIMCCEKFAGVKRVATAFQ